MTDEQIQQILQRIERNLRITKVAATRSVKGRGGDFLAGYAAGYDSVQDEPAGPAKDLVSVQDEGAVVSQGMSLREARIAHYLVAMQADVSAHEAAWASGSMSASECSDAIRSIRSNYGKLIRAALHGDSDHDV